MTELVSITLSAPLSERVRQIAKARDEDVVALVEQALNERFPSGVEEQTLGISIEPDPAVEWEMNAYIQLHPELKRHFYGKYIALYQGQLVDQDELFDVLFDRIEESYPNQFVWISKVEEEPIGTMTVRSPQFLRE